MAQNKERIIKAGDYNLDVAEILSYKIAGGVPGEVQPFRIDIQNIILIEKKIVLFLFTKKRNKIFFATKIRRSSYKNSQGQSYM